MRLVTRLSIEWLFRMDDVHIHREKTAFSYISSLNCFTLLHGCITGMDPTFDRPLALLLQLNYGTSSDHLLLMWKPVFYNSTHHIKAICIHSELLPNYPAIPPE
jgi:hypothetical protein